MEQFIKAIENIKNSYLAANVNNNLYDMCNNRLHAWGNAQYLADKLRAISNACGDRLEKSFSKTVEGKGVVESYLFKGNVNDLYTFAAKYLLDNSHDDLLAITGINFRYDWDEVTSVVRNTVACAVQLNNLIIDAVRQYNVKYVNGFDERTRLPSFMQLSSALLHYHFPQAAFMYDKALRKKASKLFASTQQCALCDTVVSKDVKEELFLRYVNVANYLRDEFVSNYELSSSFWKMDFVNYCAYVYVLGCFVKQRLTVDNNINMFALVNEVVNNVV